MSPLGCPSCEAPAPVRRFHVVSGREPGYEPYTCPNCGLETIREELIAVAGPSHVWGSSRGSGGGQELAFPTLPFAVSSVTTMTMYDATGSTRTLTSTPFTVELGETIVICIGHDGCGVLENHVYVGSTSGILAVGYASEISLCASIWYITGASGTVTARVEWDTISPFSAAATITRMRGMSISPLDKTAYNFTAHEVFSTTPDTGATGGLLEPDEVVIANITSITPVTDTALTWAGGFTGTQRAGTSTNPTFDVTVNEGRLLAIDGLTKIGSGTLPSDTAWTACVASFKRV